MLQNIKTINILPTNYVSRELQSLLYPIYVVQIIFLISKYTIQDDLITTNRKKATFITVMILFGIFILHGYRMLITDYTEFSRLQYSGDISYLLTFIRFFIVCFSTFVLFGLNIIHSHNNVQLIVKLQIIHNCINFHKEHCNNFILWNWFTLFIVMLSNILLLALYKYSKYDNIVDFCIDIFLFFVYDLNVHISVRLLNLLTKYLTVWSQEIYNTIDHSKGDYDMKIKAYQNILEAYRLLQKIFEVYMFSSIADTFLRSLWYIKIQLDLFLQHSEAYEEFDIFTAIFYVTKGIFILIWLCVRAEKFYKAIDDAESVCMTRLKNRSCSDAEKNLHKTVIRLKHHSFDKISLCGLFDLDGVLFLNFMGLITSYTIVLLQIAFL